MLRGGFTEVLTPPFWKLSPIWIIFNEDFTSCILGGEIVYTDIVGIELQKTVFYKSICKFTNSGLRKPVEVENWLTFNFIATKFLECPCIWFDKPLLIYCY